MLGTPTGPRPASAKFAGIANAAPMTSVRTVVASRLVLVSKAPTATVSSDESKRLRPGATLLLRRLAHIEDSTLHELIRCCPKGRLQFRQPSLHTSKHDLYPHQRRSCCGSRGIHRDHRCMPVYCHCE